MFDTYYEKELVINGRELKYSGIFRADELFATINRALEAKGYHKREKKTEELVMEEGRQTHIELRPYKKKTNYGILILKIRLTLSNVVEELQEQEGLTQRFDKGDILMIFDAWVYTDYEHRWGMKPAVYFLKGLFNKFVYRWPLEGSFQSEVSSDTAYMYSQIRKLLRSYGGEQPLSVSEEEIRKEVEQEIEREATSAE